MLTKKHRAFIFALTVHLSLSSSFCASFVILLARNDFHFLLFIQYFDISTSLSANVKNLTHYFITGRKDKILKRKNELCQGHNLLGAEYLSKFS